MAWVCLLFVLFRLVRHRPLMPVIREELHLTREQIGNTIIASVSITILARLIIGWLLDRFGPRRTYTALLILGSSPSWRSGWRMTTPRS
jgi:NNP family nitrate/nitrite transporter-like MFS transporter